MATGSDLIENLLKIDPVTVGVTAMRATSEEFEDRQRDQMLRGKGESRNIGRYRSRSYAAMKASMNSMAGTGNVDLRLTGRFQDGIEIKIAGDEYTIGSTDPKEEKLEEKYGGQIFGLNPGTKSDYIEDDLIPAVTEVLTKITGLKAN